MTTPEQSGGQPTDLVVVTVAQDRCIGSGSCEMLEEQTFELDDDTNIAGVVGDASLPRERALIVIDRCPSSAISIAPSPVDDAELTES